MSASKAEIALPQGVTPRLLSREQAAAYVGLSPGAFDAEVQAGTFPKPFPLRGTRRNLWDRAALDSALDSRMAVYLDLSALGGSRDERKRRWQARQDRPKKAS